MRQDEFRNLQHGDKINGPDGVNFIVHNNHRSGSGMVVAVRTVVIAGRDCNEWNITKKKTTKDPLQRTVTLVGPGTYLVEIVRKL